MIKYDPEYRLGQTLDEGYYQATVTEVTESESKAGNGMYVVDLEVWDNDGNSHIVKDYIVPAYDLGRHKMHQYAIAVGKESEYKAGTFDMQDAVAVLVRIYLKVRRTQKDGKEYENNSVFSVDQQEEARAKDATPTKKPKDGSARLGGGFEPITEDDIPF